LGNNVRAKDVETGDRVRCRGEQNHPAKDLPLKEVGDDENINRYLGIEIAKLS
jgi:hypothetical protein